jgi:hypothetical protein
LIFTWSTKVNSAIVTKTEKSDQRRRKEKHVLVLCFKMKIRDNILGEAFSLAVFHQLQRAVSLSLDCNVLVPYHFHDIKIVYVKFPSG